MFDFECTEYIDIACGHLFEESVLASDCGITYQVCWYVQEERYPFIQVMGILEAEDFPVLSCDETKVH